MLDKYATLIQIYKMGRMDYKEFVKTACNIYKNEYKLDYDVVLTDKGFVRFNENNNTVEYNPDGLSELLHRMNKYDIDKFIYDSLKYIINYNVLAHQYILKNNNDPEGIILNATNQTLLFNKLLDNYNIEELYELYSVAKNYSPYIRLAKIKTNDILRSIELDPRYKRLYNSEYYEDIFKHYNELNRLYITEAVSPTREFFALMGLEEDGVMLEKSINIDNIDLIDQAKYGLSLTKKQQKNILK